MRPERIETIFFDLDHTLWDYEVNSRETLTDLFHDHSLRSLLGCSLDAFLSRFREVNDSLWDLYNHHKIDREVIRTERFRKIFETFEIADHPLSASLSEEYIRICPTKPNLFPHATRALDYLRGKYPLHIITNGFNDVQGVKIRSAKLEQYFDIIITSETAGHRKPSREIFDLACKRAGASNASSLMIGDNLKADIEGAMGARLQAMYFNPARMPHASRPDFEITCLSELLELL